MPNQEPMEDIKRLLILLLVKLGSTSDELALALQVDASAVRKMLPGRKIKKLVAGAEG